MVRTVVAVVVGLIVWFVVATLVNLLFRALWPGYAEVEIGMNFTLAMLLGRLLLGALFPLRRLDAGPDREGERQDGQGARYPVDPRVHSGPLPRVDKFPLAYHLIFLASLLPVTVLSARLFGPGSVDRQGATT
jgi:hypothetical protein